MESINPKQIYEKLNNKYLDFVVKTECRNNKALFDELYNLFGKKGVLYQDLIIQALPEYEVENRDIFAAGFDKKFDEFLKTTKIEKPYVHQFLGWENINCGKSCVVATGTGSGKTETFIMPILKHCADNNSKGIKAMLIYPLKALAKDQKERLDNYLINLNKIYNTNVTCGIFDGDLGNSEKEEMIQNPPNILITNYVMLERMLIDPKYSKIFDNVDLKYLVLDEIHYYSGAQGIDVSLLIRRLQYLLSKTQKLDKIQYIGTSATLGEYDIDEILDFLKRLFNHDFSSEDIIKPVYSKEYENNYLKIPKKLEELSEIELKNSKLRTHAFYRSPPPVYRCLTCGKIDYVPKEKCSCGSKLLFEIYTCKDCGNEYYKYNFSKKIKSGGRNKSSTVTYNALRTSPLQKYDMADEDYGELFISRKNYENSVPLKICTECLSISSENSNICKICEKNDFLDIYAIEKGESQRNLLKSINDKYCPKCEFDGHSHGVLTSIGDLPDEFCSKHLFEDLFLDLPKTDDKKRLLVFTDSVQRASRFARDIEEHNLEKIVQKKLYDKIVEINEIDIDELMFGIIKELKRETNLEQEYEVQLKIKMYDELFAKGSNVNSLANKNVFNVFLESDVIPQNDLIPIINTFFEKNQIFEYYNILTNNEEVNKRTGFFNDEELKKRIYKNIHKTSKTKDMTKIGLNEISSREEKIERYLKKLYENQVLTRQDDKYFIMETYIKVKKIGELSKEDYLIEWGDSSRIELLRSSVDTGKTGAEDRKRIEESFKSSEKKSINFLVATPTLELGIDIGDLNAVGLLHAPPSPAQYVQRIGRGGRSGNSGMGVTFLSKSAVDSHYYEDIKNLVLGDIKPPSYRIDLELPLSKAFFSLFIYYLLNETNFTLELSKDWRRIETWEHNFNETISQLWKKYENGFYDSLRTYLGVANINYNFDGLVDLWIKKFSKHVEFQKSITINQKRRNMNLGDIYSYFQEAGLLPDYAFGRGGPNLIIKDKLDSKPVDIITGYSLKEVFPPSTIDHGKHRYECEKIWRGKALKKISDQYFVCDCSQDVIYTKDTEKCPLCGRNLIKQDKKIYEPRVIDGKYSYLRKPRKAIFKSFIFNIPADFNVNEKLSNAFNCEVGQIFSGVIRGNKKSLVKYCESCGRVLIQEDNAKKCICGNKNLIDPTTGKIHFGTKFKTRAVTIDIPEGCDKKTLLNALVSAMVLESGCEGGEIDGIENAIPGKLIIFDNVEGGVGFVDILIKRYNDVLNTAKKLCEMDCCQNGCIKCIGGYWRQSDIPMLSKRSILPYFDELIRYSK